MTTSREHTGDAARAIVERGVDLLVAWGGDGTVNQVGAALVGRGIPLGIVPAGSGNGLARELGVDRNPRRALETALRGDTRTIDVGELGGKYFFNVAGTGFDSHLAEVFDRGGRRGVSGYAAALWREVGGYQARTYAVRVEGAEPDLWPRAPALLVAVANSRQYGNGAVIAPLARLDDGLLELVVVPPLSLSSVAWQARRLFTNSVHRVPGIRMRSVRSGEIATDTPQSFHVDGEVATGAATLGLAVHPGALAVRVRRR